VVSRRETGKVRATSPLQVGWEFPKCGSYHALRRGERYAQERGGIWSSAVYQKKHKHNQVKGGSRRIGKDLGRTRSEKIRNVFKIRLPIEGVKY